jgi:flagellum-specific peptidoglycan hydrolase FlgJ
MSNPFSMTKEEKFIGLIKEAAIKCWVAKGVLPSLTIAQAILESGWGESDVAIQAKNYFGIKATEDWKHETVVLPTREYINGEWITVDATWRKYQTVGGSIEDHALFFTSTAWRTENYKHVIGETDYRKACVVIKEAGYATDPNYTQLLIDIIEKHKLFTVDIEAIVRTTKQQVDKEYKLVDGCYIVQEGDTLTSIGIAFDIPLKTIIAGNPDINPNVIHVGDKIRLRK